MYAPESLIMGLSAQNNSLLVLEGIEIWSLDSQRRIRGGFEERLFPWIETTAVDREAQRSFTGFKWLLFLWFKGWNYPKRGKGRRKGIISGLLPLTLTPPADFFFFFLFLSSFFLYFPLWKVSLLKKNTKLLKQCPLLKRIPSCRAFYSWD